MTANYESHVLTGDEYGTFWDRNGNAGWGKITEKAESLGLGLRIDVYTDRKEWRYDGTVKGQMIVQHNYSSEVARGKTD